MDKNLRSLYLILGMLALVLILTGILLPFSLNLLSIKLSEKVLYLFQVSFIVSGILDIGLIFYAKKKLG